MTWIRPILGTALALVALEALGAGTCGDELCAPDAVHGYAYLLARSVFAGVERGAFIVKQIDGRLGFVWWQSNEERRACYSGRVPANAIAVAHTHPTGDRLPSAHDVEEAQRIHMPIVVITSDSVTVARADGTVDTLKGGRHWRKSRRQ